MLCVREFVEKKTTFTQALRDLLMFILAYDLLAYFAMMASAPVTT